jgi:hypothetical protein
MASSASSSFDTEPPMTETSAKRKSQVDDITEALIDYILSQHPHD